LIAAAEYRNFAAQSICLSLLLESLPVQCKWEDGSMGSKSIIDAIDEEIARLREVRSLLARTSRIADSKQVSKVKAAAKKSTKRRLSPEARARIAEAQRKRWAAVRKAKK
jgi:hypothetical protein